MILRIYLVVLPHGTFRELSTCLPPVSVNVLGALYQGTSVHRTLMRIWEWWPHPQGSNILELGFPHRQVSPKSDFFAWSKWRVSWHWRFCLKTRLPSGNRPAVFHSQTPVLGFLVFSLLHFLPSLIPPQLLYTVQLITRKPTHNGWRALLAPVPKVPLISSSWCPPLLRPTSLSSA